MRYRTRDLTRLLPGTARPGLRRMEKVTGRTDDMMIVRGVNVFPTQIEEIILGVPGLSPYFQCVLTRPGRMDELTVNVEADPAVPEASVRRSSGEVVAARVKDRIGSTCRRRRRRARRHRAVGRQGPAHRRPPPLTLGRLPRRRQTRAQAHKSRPQRTVPSLPSGPWPGRSMVSGGSVNSLARTADTSRVRCAVREAAAGAVGAERVAGEHRAELRGVPAHPALGVARARGSPRAGPADVERDAVHQHPLGPAGREDLAPEPVVVGVQEDVGAGDVGQRQRRGDVPPVAVGAQDALHPAAADHGGDGGGRSGRRVDHHALVLVPDHPRVGAAHHDPLGPQQRARQDGHASSKHAHLRRAGPPEVARSDACSDVGEVGGAVHGSGGGRARAAVHQRGQGGQRQAHEGDQRADPGRGAEAQRAVDDEPAEQ